MSSVSTHVLDAVRGVPAADVAVTLFAPDGTESTTAVTDADGRVGSLGSDLGPGVYRLRFATGEYFAAQGVPTFYPEVTIAFIVEDDRHYHVPLLLSPFAYSTYRGS
ncbi:hydroxyisourate hydrolase [Nocardia sp. CDC159]|uniref:5-hydroxyisourate hydrolase n=1 Tax=Nocardia pulmonis TaxID=2951408 RepID=A0A9X2E5P7_9NOCA|nr:MULTISPECIES: hydroxyisourate hydrolase [Nocardia]MCM6774792.1 hydroxyisourate hydrolase [Nocardia pulmonis]MCM6789723.1 hydroxyisourate hydrolase [Nocardia sp. CDC159]